MISTEHSQVQLFIASVIFGSVVSMLGGVALGVGLALALLALNLYVAYWAHR